MFKFKFVPNQKTLNPCDVIVAALNETFSPYSLTVFMGGATCYIGGRSGKGSIPLFDLRQQRTISNSLEWFLIVNGKWTRINDTTKVAIFSSVGVQIQQRLDHLNDGISDLMTS